jgi:hypothetical protein
MELINIKGMGIEELDKICIPVEIPEDCNISYEPYEHEDIDGIRFFKKPLKVDAVDFGYTILDKTSLSAVFGDENLAYVFAISITNNDNMKINELFHNCGMKLGYSIFDGVNSEELSYIG